MEKKSKRKPPVKNPGRNSGELVVLGIEISRQHAEAIEKCKTLERRTKRAIIELALEAYFKERGLWPPPAES